MIFRTFYTERSDITQKQLTNIFIQGFQSLTRLYSDDHREPIPQVEDIPDSPSQDIKEVKKYLKDVEQTQVRLIEENRELKQTMMKLMAKMEELEVKLR